MNLAEVRQRLLDAYDPDDLVDILDISSEDILDRFQDKLEEYAEREYDDGEEETGNFDD